ncbi:hypothetical protein [Desulfobulbus elongatus]|uniref:hypothetical protein n=1 Tax=Desulfobulbus elongatus TaxID=53332 RepID=UPI00048946E1|nr:hypothetical protein [Desulfobulbus elongatus]
MVGDDMGIHVLVASWVSMKPYWLWVVYVCILFSITVAAAIIGIVCAIIQTAIDEAYEWGGMLKDVICHIGHAKYLNVRRRQEWKSRTFLNERRES